MMEAITPIGAKISLQTMYEYQLMIIIFLCVFTLFMAFFIFHTLNRLDKLKEKVGK